MASPQNIVSKLTALVVDDNIINRKIHQKMLDKFGVKSQGVENGKEAVDIHWCGQKFDLILMDMDMPIMNGIEVYVYFILRPKFIYFYMIIRPVEIALYNRLEFEINILYIWCTVIVQGRK